MITSNRFVSIENVFMWVDKCLFFERRWLYEWFYLVLVDGIVYVTAFVV